MTRKKEKEHMKTGQFSRIRRSEDPISMDTDHWAEAGQVIAAHPLPKSLLPHSTLYFDTSSLRIPFEMSNAKFEKAVAIIQVRILADSR